METGLFIIMIIGAVVAIESPKILYGLGLLAVAAAFLSLSVGGPWPASVQLLTLAVALYILNKNLLVTYQPLKSWGREPLATLTGIIFIVIAYMFSLGIIQNWPVLPITKTFKFCWGDVLAALFVLGLAAVAAKYYLAKDQE